MRYPLPLTRSPSRLPARTPVPFGLPSWQRSWSLLKETVFSFELPRFQYINLTEMVAKPLKFKAFLSLFVLFYSVNGHFVISG